MNYSIPILRKAQKELVALPGGVYERVRDTIGTLGSEPRPPGSLKLIGREEIEAKKGREQLPLALLACAEKSSSLGM